MTHSGSATATLGESSIKETTLGWRGWLPQSGGEQITTRADFLSCLGKVFHYIRGPEQIAAVTGSGLCALCYRIHFHLTLMSKEAFSQYWLCRLYQNAPDKLKSRCIAGFM